MNRPTYWNASRNPPEYGYTLRVAERQVRRLARKARLTTKRLDAMLAATVKEAHEL